MYRQHRIAVVMPAYNEEAAIASSICQVPSWVDRLIVVDDGSTDETSSVLKVHSGTAMVVRHPRNLGVGAAIASGYRCALEEDADIAVVMAGDGQMHAMDLPAVLDPIVEGKADYAKGNRFASRGVWCEMPTARILGNIALSLCTKLTSGYWSVFDSQCGYTAIHRRTLEALDLEEMFPGYGYPNDLLARLRTARARLAQVPVRAVYGPGWKSGITPAHVLYPIAFVLARSWFVRMGAYFPKSAAAAIAHATMTIGFVTTSFPRWSGDYAGGFVADHVRWFQSQRLTVEVVAAAPAPGRTAPAIIRSPSPEILRIPARWPLFYAGGAPEALGSDPRAMIEGLRFCLRAGMEMTGRRSWRGVVGHWLIPAAIAAIARPRLPLLAIAHSGDVDLICRSGLAGAFAALFRARRAKMIFVGDHLRRRFAGSVPAPLKEYVESAAVIPMGVEVERFESLEVLRRPRRITFLGRLVEIKGVEVLLAALPRLSRIAEVLIAGDGPLASRVADRALAAGARYLGPVCGPERDRLLASSEVVMIPSIASGQRREGFPVVALEAMAAGAALVASRSGGLAELPREAVTHTPAGDANALARSVEDLLDDPERRRRQVDSARGVARRLDWRAVGPRLYTELEAAGLRSRFRSSA